MKHRPADRRSRNLGIALLLVALAVSPAVAHDDHPPKKVLDEALYRSTAMPDRIILTWSGDPARSQAVTWRTDTSVNKAIAQIAPAEPGPGFVNKANEHAAATTPHESDLGTAHYHSVNFQQLEPATKYAYRVGDGVNWSEWFQFQTAAVEPAPFSFIYFGDAQNSVREHWSRVIREAHSDAPKARFMIHAGDLINSGNRDAEWGEWFGAGGWLNAMVPSVPTPGNHEYPRDSRQPLAARRLSHHWRPQFTLPTNGPQGLEETVYTIDYQGTRIISLNSNEQQPEQVAWLEAALADNPNTWTIVTFHHPVYSTSRGRDNPEIRKLWKPLFDKHRVDLVLQGHDHAYARFSQQLTENVPSGANVRSPEGGTVYVVSVSGPKMYELERRPDMRRAAENTQLYQIISVEGDALRYEARTATGELYDAFRLNKRPGQINELVDAIPDTPERRRSEAESRKN
ncbi:MAG: fibronectin type III domain-containing protein [Pirellulales bacterium]